jgi:hypothetical protein
VSDRTVTDPMQVQRFISALNSIANISGVEYVSS